MGRIGEAAAVPLPRGLHAQGLGMGGPVGHHHGGFAQATVVEVVVVRLAHAQHVDPRPGLPAGSELPDRAQIARVVAVARCSEAIQARHDGVLVGHAHLLLADVALG